MKQPNNELKNPSLEHMNKLKDYVLILVVILLCSQTEYAQTDVDEKKFEVGAQFSALGISDPVGLNLSNPGDPQKRTEAGFGGRFGYNLNRFLALEAEVNFFPGNFTESQTNATGGRITQGLFGAKAGIRKGKVGIFGKVRPGFVSSDSAVRVRFPNGNGTDPNNRFGLESVRATQFTLDIGGVFEVYPTRRTILRFDLGDTITRYPAIPFVCFPAGTTCPEKPITHKAQFSVGFGFRF